ncbi:MAG: pyrroline-5-carboxylate reductase [Sphingomonas sp.]|jgi:pyrroline-5-carboxylate reductase|uniref:pyrroline-5-carboxylate reductase n=1 Tax=Sphingomonas sp. TaxID=28214 RepID=UPI003561CE40
MNLGFIGTGTISAAIVRGLGPSFGERGTIHLSPRSATVAAALAAEWPHVRVAASNQAVLDASDVVMLAVRPQVAREVIPPLRFRPDHHVISLIATLSLETLGDLVALARSITKAVPLPAVALGRGATAIYPPDPIAASLFDRTGTTIQVEDPASFDALSAATATMASWFGFAESIAAWLIDNGIPAGESRRYVGAIFDGLAATAATMPGHDFPALAADHATPGGLNEQLLDHLTQEKLFAGVRQGLDAILARIEGRAAPES